MTRKPERELRIYDERHAASCFLLVAPLDAPDGLQLDFAGPFRAPCKGTVFQRVRIPPSNFRSSR